jgi:thymidine kinase
MCSGKTTQLIRSARAAARQGTRCLVLNSSIDTRSPPQTVCTHDGVELSACKVSDVNTVSIDHYTMIFIDEAQFQPNLVPFVHKCLARNKIVHAYGLNGDYRQRLLGTMHLLLPYADSMRLLTAQCGCGEPAIYSQRLDEDVEDVEDVIDVAAEYLPKCRNCIER